MRDVSRGTERPDAAVVEAWFGPASAQAHAYAELLTTLGVQRGLIGPREAGRVWSRHLLNCVVVHPLVRHGATVADVGSGAGLPGLVIALARPDLSVTLIEPLLRRSAFLTEAAASLQIANVTVLRSRAEDLEGHRYDVLTARAVAPLHRLAGWALPLCRPGGELIAWKGANVDSEIAAVRPTLARLGAGRVSVERCGVGVVEPPATVVRIQSSRSTMR